jgi:hypothetical protein
MDKNKVEELYLKYLNYCRNNQWDWEMITNHLKKTEDKVQNYYNEFNQEEFEAKLKESEIFRKRWGVQD